MNKQSIINLVAQAFMFAVNLCISFFLVPYITKAIGVEAYGFVGLANDFVSYAQIITLAINSMAARFITIKVHAGKTEEANKYYSSVVISNIILSSILAIVGILLIVFLEHFVNISSSLIFDVKLLFALMFANFIISIITSTFSVATFCTNKLYLTSIKTIVSQIMRVIVLFSCFFLFKPSVYYIGLASVISTAYLGYCNYKYSKTLTPELVISRKYFNIKYIKILLSSGIWNTITKISGILSHGLDLLISNIFIGSTGMGIISVSKTIPSVILNAFGSLASVFAPELTISYAKKDYKEMKRQLLFSIKILGVFSAIPITILFAYGNIFYSLWVPAQNSILLYMLTCISVLGMCMSLPLEPLWNIFTITNKVKNSSIYLLINSVLTIIVVVVLFQFIPNKLIRMFIVVSVSICFSVIRSLTFLPLYGAKCLNLKKTTFYPALIKNLSAIFISTIISIGIKKILNINTWMMLVIAAALTSIITLIISVFLITNKDDRLRFKIIYTQKIRKKVIFSGN